MHEQPKIVAMSFPASGLACAQLAVPVAALVQPVTVLVHANKL